MFLSQKTNIMAKSKTGGKINADSIVPLLLSYDSGFVFSSKERLLSTGPLKSLSAAVGLSWPYNFG